jgi:2-methylcitrate dehydratase PrpD
LTLKIGKVTVETADGRTLHGRVDEPKGDPGNTLTRSELEQKALRLAEFSGAATAEEMSRIFKEIRKLTQITKIKSFLSSESSYATAQPPFLSVRSR